MSAHMYISIYVLHIYNINIHTHFYIFAIFINFFCLFIFCQLTFPLDVTLQFFHMYIYFPYILFYIFQIDIFLHVHSYIPIFKFSYMFGVFYTFYVFFKNFSIICVSDYKLLFMRLNVCVTLNVNVCMVYLCACIQSYLLWRVSNERQGMLTL